MLDNITCGADGPFVSMPVRARVGSEHPRVMQGTSGSSPWPAIPAHPGGTQHQVSPRTSGSSARRRGSWAEPPLGQRQREADAAGRAFMDGYRWQL